MIYLKAGEKDIEAISSLFISSFGKRIKKRFNIALSKKVVVDIIELYLDSAEEGFIVAKEKDKVIGFICAVKKVYLLWLNLFSLKRIYKLFLFLPRSLFIFPPSFRYFFVGGHVITLAVDKKYQRKKIALKLVQKAFSILRKQGVKEVYFQIPADDNRLVDKFLKYNCKIVKKISKYGRWLILKRNLLQKV